jgi:hypothetical protein
LGNSPHEKQRSGPLRPALQSHALPGLRKEVEETISKVMTIEKANAVINRIQKAYLVLACLTAFAVIFKISGGAAGSIAAVPAAGLAFIVYFTAYMGLRRRKIWALPFILILAASSLLISFLSSLETAQDAGSLLSKGGDIVIFIFSAYQIHFFSKKEVKVQFNAKGTIIF